MLTFAYCDQPLGELTLSSSTNKKTSFSFKLNDNFESISEDIDHSFNYFIQVNNNFTPDLKYTVNSDYMLDKKLVSQFEFGISKNKEIKYSNPAVDIHDVYEINGNNYLHLRISPIQKFGNKIKVLDNIHIELNGIHNPIILDSENIAILLNEQNNDKSPVLMIIAPDGQNIYNLMTPLINWKKMKGFEVLYYELSDVGYTSSAIKSFIQNAYDTWDNPPKYLCIVGDADGPYAVPTFNENLSVYNGETDLPYTLVSGNDYISDLAIGRLSVRSLSELANVINKIINYEQYPFVDGTNWFQRGLCVGDSSISGSSTVITNQLIAELMLKNNMNEVVEVYHYPFVNQIQNVINSGVAFYNYRGFAGSSGWDKDGADELSNGYMLPVVSVITCDTGSFLNDEQSIAENFLRAGTISIPKGGIAGIGMSTQGTHTMFNNCLDYGLYHGIFSEKIEFLGDVVNFAKNNLRLNYPDNPNNYVDIFSHWINLMGDPTLSIWTTQPKNLTANYDHSIDFGQNQLEVIVSNADDLIKRARVTMTDNDFNLIEKPIFLESKTQQGKVGYHAVLPLTYKDNFYSVINLGWISDRDPEKIKNIIEEIQNKDSFYAYTRHLTDKKQSFVPENQLDDNIWFSILKSDLERYYKSNFNSRYYFVLFDPRIKPDINPLAFLRNNHLNYSITWFLLSLSSAIMILIIRRKRYG